MDGGCFGEVIGGRAYLGSQALGETRAGNSIARGSLGRRRGRVEICIMLQTCTTAVRGRSGINGDVHV